MSGLTRGNMRAKRVKRVTKIFGEGDQGEPPKGNHAESYGEILVEARCRCGSPHSLVPFRLDEPRLNNAATNGSCSAAQRRSQVH
jgi:hypothetical protein